MGQRSFCKKTNAFGSEALVFLRKLCVGPRMGLRSFCKKTNEFASETLVFSRKPCVGPPMDQTPGQTVPISGTVKNPSKQGWGGRSNSKTASPSLLSNSMKSRRKINKMQQALLHPLGC